MARQIRLSFPNSNIEAVATLLEQDAPDTCEHIWQLLERPLVVRCEMDHFAGGELFFPTAPAPNIPYENQTVFPAAGDLLFFHYPGALPHGDVTYKIAIAYRRGAKGLQRAGWIPGNIFATVTHNLAELPQAAKEVIEKGPQPLRIERVPEATLPWLREGIIQAGIVVKDLDRAVETYWNLFGIGPWRIYSYGKPPLQFASYHSQPSDARWRIALCWVGAFCLELIEVGEGDTVYSDFIREHGYGLHHLGVSPGSVAAAVQQATEANFQVLQEGGGQGLDGSGHFVYLSTEEALGVMIELIESPKVRIQPDRIYPS